VVVVVVVVGPTRGKGAGWSWGVLRRPPPVSAVAREIGLESRVGGNVLEQRVCLAKWSGRREVREAWERLAAREGLRRDVFDRATWGFVDLGWGGIMMLLRV
jgi:hypothetical protein